MHTIRANAAASLLACYHTTRKYGTRRVLAYIAERNGLDVAPMYAQDAQNLAAE